MPTKNRDVIAADGQIHVATGPRAVTFNFKKGVGEWSIETGANEPPADGHWTGQEPISLELGTGEMLYISGNGRLVITADALEI
ncbi:hypothetical protein [Roseobacter sp. S98]|uniref:hypothetical protein n=1 Tax=Roseobacter algicola (ex Choi et al. 2025) (nom. illeg.) TaxID=3092138 RepID=UPI0035C77275